MLKILNGASFVAMLQSGLQNLENNRSYLNDLNVFPVPDGDTGTNMVMTVRYGFDAIKGKSGSLSEIAGSFSSAAVFGARGNSGVIISQFFKGLSLGLGNCSEISPQKLAEALDNGCRSAYSAVEKPVEGTMLTVIKDGANALKSVPSFDNIDDVVRIFLENALVSLKKTPEVLPILKKANVVDSGGSGVVCFFEGIMKHLNGEILEEIRMSETSEGHIDLTKFDKHTDFHFGYCVEGVVQIISDGFNFASFKKDLDDLGEYLVASQEGDKVKLHIHAKVLGKLMDYCQTVGEFLTVKIENMTVQNIMKNEKNDEKEKFIYRKERNSADFAVVAVATNSVMQKMFYDMGADVSILSEIAPSSQDFIDAFKLTGANKILVFPNSPNSILSSMQAGSMYKDGRVFVLNCRSCAECYSTLPIIDFDSTIDDAVSIANDTISQIYQLSIYHASKSVKFDDKTISKDDFFALSSNKILGTARSLEDLTISCISDVLNNSEISIITLFFGENIDEEYAEYIKNEVLKHTDEIEISCVYTKEDNYTLTVFFE